MKERASAPGARVNRGSLKLDVASVVLAACLILGAASTLIPSLVAAFLFLVFPTNVVSALSAITDMSLVAAVLLAFGALVHLPPRLGPFVAPLLLVVPFLIRETGALLAVPMAALQLCDRDTGLGVRLRRAATLLVLSVLVLSGVLCVAVFTDNSPSW